jgi:hypothetical protein
MPTISSAVLPKPKDWNEFEDICLSSSKSRWGNPNFTRFGRAGQKQDGVDIYGHDNLGQLIGVQCKNTLHSLTESIIDSELLKAESFSSPLSALYIATSASSDVHLQKYVMELSRQRVASGKFGVGILFWSDIEQDLGKDQNEVARFYPQFFNSQVSSRSIPVISEREKDISRVHELLQYIDIESTNYYLEMAPRSINMKFLEHVDAYQQIISSPLFILYDKELENKLFCWLNKWTEMVNQIRFAPYNYIANADRLSFIMPGDFCRTPEENEMYERLEGMRNDFFQLQAGFCSFIHEKYPEIELRDTSLMARKFHAEV